MGQAKCLNLCLISSFITTLMLIVLNMSSMTDELPYLKFIPPSQLHRMERIPNLHSSLLGPLLSTVKDGFDLFEENKTLFVIETDETQMQFKPTLLCAVESAIRSNSELNVVIITASQDTVKNAPLFLTWFENIRIHLINTSSFMKSSQLAPFWWRSEEDGAQSASMEQNFNHILSFILLYNYGGVYIEQDVLVMRPLTFSPKNFVVPKGFNVITTSLIRMTSFHPLMELVIQTTNEVYASNTTESERNALRILTLATLKYCEREDLNFPFLNRKCPNNLDVMPIKTAFPLNARDGHELYSPRRFLNIMKLSRHKYSLVFKYFAHLLPSYLKSGKMEGNEIVDPHQPLIELMSDYCPYCQRNLFTPLVGLPWNQTAT